MYRIFDTTLECDFPLPELSESPGERSSLSVRLGDPDLFDAAGFETAFEWFDYSGEPICRCECRGEEYLYVFPHHASFHIAADGVISCLQHESSSMRQRRPSRRPRGPRAPGHPCLLSSERNVRGDLIVGRNRPHLDAKRIRNVERERQAGQADPSRKRKSPERGLQRGWYPTRDLLVRRNRADLGAGRFGRLAPDRARRTREGGDQGGFQSSPARGRDRIERRPRCVLKVSSFQRFPAVGIRCKPSTYTPPLFRHSDTLLR